MQATNVQALHEPVIAGLDIGNGWTVLVSDSIDPIIFQSLAAPVADMGNAMLGRTNDSPLVIEGVAWDAGFAPNATSRSPAIYKGAALSDEHFALFLEALHRFGSDIDTLVVGLPSDMIGDRNVRMTLKNRLEGSHTVRGKEIHVDRVGVFEQPIGTARKFIDDTRDQLGDQTFLIVDVGYSTTDVNRIRVSISDYGVPAASSDFAMSAWMAFSQVCETASKTIKAATNLHVTPSMVSRAMRFDAKIKKGGDPIDARPYVEAASEGVARSLTGVIKEKLRTLEDIDLVLVTGGPAQIFSRYLDLGRPIEVMRDSAIANAQGYVLLAKDHA